MQPNNPFASIRLKSLHINLLIDPIELELNEISIGLQGVVYFFSNTIETETERTAHMQS